MNVLRLKSTRDVMRVGGEMSQVCERDGGSKGEDSKWRGKDVRV